MNSTGICKEGVQLGADLLVVGLRIAAVRGEARRSYSVCLLSEFIIIAINSMHLLR